jgi:thiamine biosynthesis lipoprotein
METFDSIRRARPLLGTFVEIDVSGARANRLQQAVDGAFDAVEKVHRLMSFHEPESDVSRLNREAFARAVAVDPWTHQVLRSALEFNRLSAGLFDITVGPLLQKWDLLPPSAGDPGPGMVGTNSADAIELLPSHCVRFTNASVRIDLGGIAKGFAVDRALDVLRDACPEGGLVNAGGDLAAFGARAQSVHIRDPHNVGRSLCLVELSNAALASSGRLFDLVRSAPGGVSAIFNPKTREPTRAIAGATVFAPSCMVADALTKVVMIGGEEATGLLEQCRASAFLVLEIGDVRISPDWPNAFLHIAA